MRSHIRSTGSDRQPGGQKIDRGVPVPVVSGPAGLTGPLSDAQGHRVGDHPAGRAQPGTGEPPVDNDQLAAVPGCLVLQHRPQLAPRGVTDGTCQRVVPQHVGDRQILDHERLVFTHETSRQLVQEVPAPIGDPGMDPRHTGASLDPVAAALLLPRQRSLRAGHTLTVLPLMTGVGDLLAGGQGEQGRQSCVDADRVRGGRHRSHGVLAQQRDVPAAGTVARDRDRGRRHPFRQWAGPHDVQGLVHLRQPHPALRVAEPAAGVLGAGTRLPLRLESRVLGPLLPEPHERRLQVAQGLLQRYRGHRRQKGQFLGLLPRGEHGRCLPVAHPLAARLPGLGAGGERQVVHLPHTPERPRQFHGLRVRRIETVFERPLHGRKPHTAEATVGHDPNTSTGHSLTLRHSAAARFRAGTAFPHPAEAGGFHTREIR